MNVTAILAILLPTVTGMAAVTVAVVGILVNNGRFNTMDSRLMRIENDMSEVKQWQARHDAQ